MLGRFLVTARASVKSSPAPLKKTPSRARKMSSDLKYREPIVLKAKGILLGTVIFMHGLGDSGDGWADGMAAIQGQLPNVKFILPHAPVRPITCNGGMKMPGWYDIIQMGTAAAGEDKVGLDASREYLNGLIKAEIDAGTPSDKIIVGGFSQGAAMTYYTAFSSEVKLAGAVTMSGYLPLAGDFESRLAKVNLDTPLLACHGDRDPVVKYARGQESFEYVEKLGIKGTFKTYKGLPHSANMEELSDVAKFIHNTLSASKL